MATTDLDTEYLRENFQAAANNLTKLYIGSVRHQREAYEKGYRRAVVDVLMFLHQSPLMISSEELSSYLRERLHCTESKENLPSHCNIEENHDSNVSPEFHREVDISTIEEIEGRSTCTDDTLNREIFGGQIHNRREERNNISASNRIFGRCVHRAAESSSSSTINSVDSGVGVHVTHICTSKQSLVAPRSHFSTDTSEAEETKGKKREFFEVGFDGESSLMEGQSTPPLSSSSSSLSSSPPDLLQTSLHTTNTTFNPGVTMTHSDLPLPNILPFLPKYTHQRQISQAPEESAHKLHHSNHVTPFSTNFPEGTPPLWKKSRFLSSELTIAGGM